jgi:ankyrin repeat protein
MIPQEAKEQLFKTAKESNVDAARKALDAGADPNAKDEYHWTPLQLATERGNTELANVLQDAATGQSGHASRV